MVVDGWFIVTFADDSRRSGRIPEFFRDFASAIYFWGIRDPFDNPSALIG
jgi:hypothetical protein